MKKHLLLLYLLPSICLAQGSHPIQISDLQHKVMEPIVIFPAGSTIDITDANKVGFGGGGTLSASLLIHSSGNSNDTVNHPYTAQNTGIIVTDANNVEILRLWVSDPNGAAPANAQSVFIGANAGLNTTAVSDTAIGFGALSVGDIGTGNNVAVGTYALKNQTTGNHNVAIGSAALYSMTTGDSNVAVGQGAGSGFSTGTDNVAIGNSSNSGSDNIESVAVGSGGDATGNNSISIGYAAFVSNDNSAVIGNEFVTDVYLGFNHSNSTVHAILHALALVGTATNDDATSGNVGEYVSSLKDSAHTQSLSNNTVANVTSISLTSGDWDVEGNVNFTETTSTVTARTAGINTTNATLPTDGSEAYCGVQSTLTSETNSITLPRKRISIAATTTVYLVAKATFSAGTCAGFGAITARRVR